MITGAMPVEVRGVDLLVATLREAPITPSARCGDLPAELEQLVLALLARAPADRPRDAFVVHDALADLLRRLGETSSPPPAMVVDEDGTGPTTQGERSSPAALTAPLAALPTAELSARWHGALGELVGEIDAARPRGEHDPGVRRATQRVEDARSLIAWLERVKSTVSEHQARVDRLETRCRSLRTTLGVAIDTLSRDRSPERAHTDAIVARRRRIREDASSLGARGARDRKARARAIDEDLGFQIEELRRQLAAHNEQLDLEMQRAAGLLEGALSALRHMTGQLVRTIEEAAVAVGS